MTSLIIAQQQHRRPAVPVVPSVDLFWSPAELAGITNGNIEGIRANWPLIANAMAARGIWDRDNAAAVAATVAIETAHTFEPVREAFWMSEEWRKDNLRYYPWYGRGFIQLTWESNYKAAGEDLGLNLVDNPDTAMSPMNAAAILAWFWETHFLPQFARRHDWREVRRRVQGGSDGLDELIAYASGLLAL